MSKVSSSLHKRLKSFLYAFQGIGELIKSEPNARIHLFATVCVVLAGLYFKLSPTEWIAVIIVIGGVFSAEGVNSSIETLGDLVSPGYHPSVKKAKDLAAGAVLLVAIAAALVGLIIFVPKILTLFNS
ncbi:diacylglycerol kinase family protein [Parabacteroides pacaensis]|uniref:diacylglycerol kinase family protein n=1 Tax=Parabacteroides pacaensis TaxID=2086575 RepID=UPI000D0EECA3|nr:diacylglycerol kinase family protein [Parabacteroides pacaensis]